MRFNVPLIALCLAGTAAFAQHGGSFRGGGVSGVGLGHGPLAGPFGRALFGSGRLGSNTGTVGNALLPFVGPIPSLAGSARLTGQFGGRRGLGNGFFPYFPFLGDYASAYAPGYNIYFLPFPEASSQEEPAKPVQSVIHEYPENDKTAAAGSEQTTFTIALKNGSRRSAETVWVQDDMLHYLDLQGMQGTLSADVIDRETTQRLNKEKNLYLQLPHTE
ncbi:MAG: hypothetical protein JOZ48_09365 [Acidobacteriaceae bacterium]|nr:hypothetical protein [Acidobacteriaceae bacterium]